jgi:hypothetical protein
MEIDSQNRIFLHLIFENSPMYIRLALAPGVIPILVPNVITPPSGVPAIACRVLNSLAEALSLFTVSRGSHIYVKPVGGKASIT